jgi:hypothetical protein
MMTKTRLPFVLGALAASLLLVTCGAQPPAGEATGTAALAPDAPKAEGGDARLYLWRASPPGRPDNYVYLFGSVHAARPDFYPLDPAIERAFDSADALAVELDPGQFDPAKVKSAVVKRALLPAGVTIKDRLSPETWGALERWLAARKIPLGTVTNFEPWFAALFVIQMQVAELGLDSSLGLDQHFMERAGAHKPIEALETLDQQLAVFDELSPELQEWVLADALDDLTDEGRAELERIVAAWKAGDAAAVYEIARAPFVEDPRREPLFEALFTRRNAGMADAVDGLLDQWNRLFVVVGAAHLAGPDGVPALLEARGYQVEQIDRTPAP